MRNKLARDVFFIIPTIIFGWALFRQFDSEYMKFEEIGITVVYILSLAISIYFLVRNIKKRLEK